MSTIPSSSTGMPSGTTTSTPPMIAQAVTSTTRSSITACRRSTLTLPQNANAVIRPGARQRPRAAVPPMMATNRRRGADGVVSGGAEEPAPPAGPVATWRAATGGRMSTSSGRPASTSSRSRRVRAA